VSDYPMVTYWRGRSIQQMAREELEAAFSELGRMYVQSLDDLAEQRKAIFRSPNVKIDWATGPQPGSIREVLK
jgi:hypothetical protein